jgi:hypothetical protein
MSSSDLTSDSSVESKPIEGKEDLDALADSIDASLDAILSEAKEGAQPAASDGDSTASVEPVIDLPVLEPPPAEVQIALSPNGTASDVLTDDMETPLPVIVEEEEPSYKAFADMVAPTDEAREIAQAKAELEAAGPSTESESPAILAESEEAESGEIMDADELIDSMTPAPVALEEAVVSAAKTEESQAFTPPPPSDEEILDHVKLPPGSTPMPMPLVASLAAEAAADQPGAELEDDQTVISPMPPMPEPSVSLPPPRRMSSAWAVPPVEATEPSILLASEGLGTKLGKMSKAPVQLSMRGLAVVVLLASALGGGVVRMVAGPGQPSVAVTSPAKAEAPVPAPAIAPIPAVAEKAAPAPAPAVVEKAAEKADKIEKTDKVEKAEKAAAPKVAAKPAAKPAAAQGTHIALAAPKPAPAKKPAAPAPAAKPKKAASGANWVDPFGQ